MAVHCTGTKKQVVYAKKRLKEVDGEKALLKQNLLLYAIDYVGHMRTSMHAVFSDEYHLQFAQDTNSSKDESEYVLWGTKNTVDVQQHDTFCLATAAESNKSTVNWLQKKIAIENEMHASMVQLRLR